jgi:TatA/E family protein of Tat protein translocase
MWEPTSNPLIILWSPGGGELIIILAIVLLLFGAKRLPDLARGMGESIRNFKAGMLMNRMSREQRQQSSDSRLWQFIILAWLAAAISFLVLSLDDFSDTQKLVLTIVLLCWIGVGYWSFGRTSRKGDDQ